MKDAIIKLPDHTNSQLQDQINSLKEDREKLYENIQSIELIPIHSFSGSVYEFDSNLVFLKNDLKGCPFIDQNGNKCDQKGNSSNKAQNTHRVLKNCPNILQQKKNERNSKAMIFDDD